MTTEKYAKRGPVILPVECPYDVLLFLTGSPTILSANEEHSLRIQYARFRETMRAAQEKRK